MNAQSSRDVANIRRVYPVGSVFQQQPDSFWARLPQVETKEPPPMKPWEVLGMTPWQFAGMFALGCLLWGAIGFISYGIWKLFAGSLR